MKEYFPAEVAECHASGEVRSQADNRSDFFSWGLERFRDEAETLAILRQKNIVRVLDVFSACGTAYMVMRYEPGHHLERALSDGRVATEDGLLEL